MLGDMLINDETMNRSMPLRSALQLGLSATDNQAKMVKELISGESELVPWKDSVGDKFSQIMVHREYSSRTKDGLSTIEWRDFLILILGDDGNDVYRNVMNDPILNELRTNCHRLSVREF